MVTILVRGMVRVRLAAKGAAAAVFRIHLVRKEGLHS